MKLKTAIVVSLIVFFFILCYFWLSVKEMDSDSILSSRVVYDYFCTNNISNGWTIEKFETSGSKSESAPFMFKVKSYLVNTFQKYPQTETHFKNRYENYTFLKEGKSVSVSVKVINDDVKYFTIYTTRSNLDEGNILKNIISKQWKSVPNKLELNTPSISHQMP